MGNVSITFTSPGSIRGDKVGTCVSTFDLPMLDAERIERIDQGSMHPIPRFGRRGSYTEQSFEKHRFGKTRSQAFIFSSVVILG